MPKHYLVAGAMSRPAAGHSLSRLRMSCGSSPSAAQTDRNEKSQHESSLKNQSSASWALSITRGGASNCLWKQRKASSSTAYIKAVSGHTAANLIGKSKNCSAGSTRALAGRAYLAARWAGTGARDGRRSVVIRVLGILSFQIPTTC